MLLWFWYCKWRILADNSFATGCKRYEINSVNKVYCFRKSVCVYLSTYLPMFVRTHPREQNRLITIKAAFT